MGLPGEELAEVPENSAACGTLGPHSGYLPQQAAAFAKKAPRLQLLAMCLGFAAALLVSKASVSKASGAGAYSLKSSSHRSRFILKADFNRQTPQQQAELLLERAVARSDGATEQIASQIDAWRGKLKWDAPMSQLTTAALNSDDAQVRNSGVEVQLAAYGLSKDNATAESLVIQARSPDRSQRIWALWSLGLLGNRGVETDRVVEVLSAQESDPSRRNDPQLEEERRWAVEGLALVGATSTVAPLLDAMHNDPSATVRERAACSLAEAGMLSHEQRLLAVPRLIDFSEDAALEAQTRAWAFQALADITKERLPNNSAAWRDWYRQNRKE